MSLTPLDIQKKEFKKSFRGFDETEVKDFLEKVSEAYEKIYKENQQLKEEIKILSERVRGYEDLETTLKKAIVLAEKTAEEVRINAEKEKEIILKEAESKAKEIISDAENKRKRILVQQEEIIKQFIIFKTRFVNFLKAQLETIDTIGLEFFMDEKTCSVKEAAFTCDEDSEEKK